MKENVGKLMLFMKKTKINFDEENKKIAKKMGISRPEADVLLFLSVNSELNRGCDMVEIRGFSKAYVSKGVGKLLQKGYISFETDAKDRRYQHIIVNDVAKPIIRELKVAEKRVFKNLWEGITDEEKNTFYSVIEKMTKNI